MIMVVIYETRDLATLSLWLALLLGSSSVVHTGKLLVVPMDGSHWVTIQAVAEKLGKRGHEVVVVIPQVSMRLGPTKHCTTKMYPVPYGQDLLNRIQAQHGRHMNSSGPFIERVSGKLEGMGNLIRFLTTTSESLLYNQGMVSYLKKQHFDAVLTDPVVPTGAILAEHLSIPAVYLLRGIPCGLDFAATACPSPASFVPRFFTLNTDHMNFRQRVLNVLVSFLEPLLCKILYRPFDNIASNVLQRDATVAEIFSHASMWLMRFDFTFEFPRPLMPNMALVGGINCVVQKPLPQVRKKIILLFPQQKSNSNIK